MTRARVLVKLGKRQSAADDFTRAIAKASDPMPEYFLERAQAQADERAKFVKVWRDRFGLQGVKSVSTGAVMSLAIASAQEALDLVSESEQAEEIPLLLSSETKNESGGDETL